MPCSRLSFLYELKRFHPLAPTIPEYANKAPSMFSPQPMAYHHMGQTDHSFCPLPLRKEWAASNTVSWMFFPVILHQLRPPSPIRLVYKCPLTGAWQFSTTGRLGNCKAQCWCLQGLLGNFQSAWHMIIGPKGQSKHTTHHTSSHYNCCLLAILQSVSLHKARWDISTPSPPLRLPCGIWFFYICRGSEIYLGPIFSFSNWTRQDAVCELGYCK